MGVITYDFLFLELRLNLLSEDSGYMPVLYRELKSEERQDAINPAHGSLVNVS